MRCTRQLLQDPAISNPDNLNFRANNHSKSAEHVYDEFNSGDWMHLAEVLSGAYPDYPYEIMPFSLYADAASPDFRRKSSISPVVVQCLNYIGDVLRRDVGKKIAGFCPKLKVCLCSQHLKCIVIACLCSQHTYI